MTTTHSSARPGRLVLVDMARGAALLAMVVYHFAWDLGYYGIVGVDVTVEPGWVLFQKAILSSFLLLSGFALVLAHGESVRWRPYWRRFLILAAAALLVTAGTLWMFPDYFVYFGILHAIAAFSLLALPFLRLPGWALLLAAMAFVVPPLLVGLPGFHQRPLAWIGFWRELPETTDIVPVFPWFGVFLLGLAAARLARPLLPRLAGLAPHGAAAHSLARLGRWSLVVYLVHQPLLLGGLAAFTTFMPPALQPELVGRSQNFLQSCEQSCASANDAAYCTSYCACALEQVEADDLWALLDRPGPERDEALGPLTRLCSAMAR